MKILTEGMDAWKVPGHDQQGLAAYYNEGTPPGGFLLCVLENDLKGACSRADEMNKRALWDIVNYLYNVFPMGSWGSKEIVSHWLAYHADRRAKLAQEKSDVKKE